MTTGRVFIITVVMALAVGLSADIPAYQSVSGPASITSQGTIPINPGPTLDNFNQGIGVNLWNCITATFAKAGSAANCAVNYPTSDAPVATPGKCLQLTYNVADSGTYAGYSSKLGPSNIAAYTAISFWVKGAVGGEFFKVELKNANTNVNTNHAAVYVTDYLDSGITTAWQQVTIPLHNFANISDWSSATEFCVTFESDQSGIVGAAKQGIIYIDDITFGNSTINVVRINYFSTKLGRTALGGNMGDMPNPYPTVSWASSSFSSADYKNPPYSLLSQYNVSSAEQWSGHFMIFGGGDDGATPIAHDFRAFRYLRFAVKARSAAENPKTFKVEIIDGTATTKGYIVTGILASDWINVSIDMTAADMNGNYLTRASMKQVNIIYEKWRIQAANGKYNGPGAVYIDDMRLGN